MLVGRKAVRCEIDRYFRPTLKRQASKQRNKRHIFPKEDFGKLTSILSFKPIPLSESSRAAAHNLSLADQFGAQLRAVQSEVDVKVDAVECPLGSVHALKVFF